MFTISYTFAIIGLIAESTLALIKDSRIKNAAKVKKNILKTLK